MKNDKLVDALYFHDFIPPPDQSPWGEIQHCTELDYGIFEVDTASHGGIMVHKNVALSALSAQARKYAFREKGFYCYEEDCDAAIPFRELLDNPNWKVPNNRTCTREQLEAAVDRSLETWRPEYKAYHDKAAAKKHAAHTELEEAAPAKKNRVKTDEAR